MARHDVHRIVSDDARKHVLRVEHARRQIPINLYLKAVHEAICTGVFPDIDPKTGDLISTNGSPISSELRLDLTKWIVNLSMPQLKSVAPPEPDESEATLRDALNTGSDAVETVRNLTTTQLKATLHALANAKTDSKPPAESPANRTPEAGASPA